MTVETVEIKQPKLKMIKFGDEFEQWDVAKKIDYLKKLASSMNQAADMMQTERNIIAEEYKVAKAQLENSESNLHIQKAIVMKAITDNNAAKEEYIRRIQELEYRVKTQDGVIESLNEKLDK